jgi:hypothetical protein
MAAPSTNHYINVIRKNVEDGDIDPISLDPIVEITENMHPKSIITFYNSYQFEEGIPKDFPLSKYNTKEFLEYYETIKNQHPSKWRNPENRNLFDLNTMKRIEHYKKSFEMFPDIKLSDINVNEIIDKISSRPHNILSMDFDYEDKEGQFRLFVTFEEVIEYYKNKGIFYDTREKAEEYLRVNEYDRDETTVDNNSENREPKLKWVIRTCSLIDTELCRHFVIENNKGFRGAFQHRQGYGIIGVSGPRNSYIHQLSTDNQCYFTTIGHLMMRLQNLQYISL